MSTDLEKLSEFVVVANRLPVDLETDEDGSKNWKRSPGGLVTALEPILRQRDGAWVGWPGVADEKVDPIVVDGLRLFPVELTSQDLAEYYEGVLQRHVVAALPRRSGGSDVRAVVVAHLCRGQPAVRRRKPRVAPRTERLSGCRTISCNLCRRCLRELRPDLTIGFFLHIPFPPVELFMQLPWRKEIVRGMLGADLIGFHLPGGANNFLFLARKLLGLKTTTAGVGVRSALGHVDFDSRVVKVGAFPISVDSAELERQSKSDSVLRRARELKEELGNPEKILLGVDRLDYTKGIDLRLQALKELLDEDRLDPEKYTMVQLATPSRERVQHYIDLRSVIEEQVGRINGDHSQIGRPVVHYLYQPVDREELIALFVAADVMLVTPMRDGMNLVAKEYVACRGDLGGALVLSEFTGAAMELRQSYLVNPHDLDGVKNTILTAVHQDPKEGRRRMAALHRQVMTHDVHQWAESFLTALAPPGPLPDDQFLTERESNFARNN